jgi:hypothetical protein
MPSYKIRNGTYALCTPEEEAERERKKAARAVAQAQEQAAEPRAQAASGGAPFAKLMRVQIRRMHGVSTTWDVFSGLLFESFRHHGNSFVLPVKQLKGVPGLSQTNWNRILLQLERRGLITVTRRPPKPPLIKVLSR